VSIEMVLIGRVGCGSVGSADAAHKGAKTSAKTMATARNAVMKTSCHDRIWPASASAAAAVL
jgi:hypothetical protein